MPAFIFVSVGRSTRSRALEPVTYSLERFTRGEKRPAGKVVKPHPIMTLISTTSGNLIEDGGAVVPKNLKTRKSRHDVYYI